MHRDLKTDNVILGKYGETIVIDWGLAMTVDREDRFKRSDEKTLLASSGHGLDSDSQVVAGTPSYMSPEQALGETVLTPASDIYSLGSILYKMLTGETPFQGSSVRHIIHKVRAGEFPRLSEVNGDMAPALESICLKAMQYEQNNRYATALELASDIERWLAGELVEVYTENWREKLVRWTQQHVLVATFALTALLALIVFVAVFLTSGHMTRMNRVTERLDELQTQAAIQATMLESEIDTLVSDVKFLATQPQIKTIALQYDNPTDETLEALAKQFEEFIDRKDSYRQARLIHHSGQEIVRVEHDKDSDKILRKISGLTIKPPADHPYVRDTLGLNEREVYLSEINLNVENGIKQSDFPVIRAATPVFTESGERFGLVVINMRFAALSRIVASSKEDGLSSKQEGLVYLTNDKGEFLMHPDEAISFCFERDLDYQVDDLFPKLATFLRVLDREHESLQFQKPTPAVYIEPPKNINERKPILNVIKSLLDDHREWTPAYNGDPDSCIEQVLIGAPADSAGEIEKRIRDKVGPGYTVHVLPQEGSRRTNHVYCRKVKFDDRVKTRFLCLVFVVPEKE